jgi:ABC-type glutathione transport system ATPase component
MESRLQLSDLWVAAQRGGDRLEILKGVSLEVADGECVGVVGESGSGKTMTLRAVMGLLPPGTSLRGSVWFGGREVTALAGEELREFRRRDVGMVFQDPHAAINPVRRIRDFLTEPHRRGPRMARREANARAEEVLTGCGIRDPARVLELYPHQLSGGMLQRVMIASVLMQRPALILADEPTTALDVTTQSTVVALLDRVRLETESSMVFVSHDIELVAAICDRIVVMYDGRLIETLTPAQLYRGEIAEPYTRALLECRPSVTQRRRRLPTLERVAAETARSSS